MSNLFSNSTYIMNSRGGRGLKDCARGDLESARGYGGK